MSKVIGRGQRLIPEYLLKYLENQKENGVNITQLVDSNGNPRFIEGEGAVSTIEGVTFTYNKWSLSGTHLMIVLAGSVASGTVIPSATIYATYEGLPSFITDKISALAGQLIDFKSVVYLASNYTTQAANADLIKADGIIKIRTTTLTLTADRNFHIQFDVMIDSE